MKFKLYNLILYILFAEYVRGSLQLGCIENSLQVCRGTTPLLGYPWSVPTALLPNLVTSYRFQLTHYFNLPRFIPPRPQTLLAVLLSPPPLYVCRWMPLELIDRQVVVRCHRHEEPP